MNERIKQYTIEEAYTDNTEIKMYEKGKLVDRKIVSNWKLYAYLERLIDEGYQQAYDVKKYEKATYNLSLYVEAFEKEVLLLEDCKILNWNLCHEYLLCVLRISRVVLPVLYPLHALYEVFQSYTQCIAQLKRVEPFCFAWDKGDVISRLVVYQQFAVAVIHLSA